MAGPAIREALMKLRRGEWVRVTSRGHDTYVGTIIRVAARGHWVHVRAVVNGVEGVRTIRYGESWPTRLSLLEVVAAESEAGYWPNPDMRICEEEECPRILAADWTAVYCSNGCALKDA